MNIVNAWQEGKPLPFPSTQLISEANLCLKSNPLALQLIHGWGVSDKIIEKYKIGFSNAEKRFYFPIFTETGFLVNIRKYAPSEFRGENTPKVIGITGCNDARFWPIENLEKDNESSLAKS